MQEPYDPTHPLKKDDPFLLTQISSARRAAIQQGRLNPGEDLGDLSQYQPSPVPASKPLN